MTDYLFPTAFSSWRPGDGSAEDRALCRVLASGQMTAAHEVAAFEEEVAAFHGRRYAVATNSGSSANLVAVAALRLREDPEFYQTVGEVNDNALVPAISWATFYAPMVQHRFTFVLRDVDDTWNARSRLNSWLPGDGTHRPIWWLNACCPVLGNAAYLPEWRAIADEDNLSLFEDCCESTGAVAENGQLVGTFGDISTGSGFYSHQISAGELGWAMTDDPELARLMRLLADHGNAGWGEADFAKSYNFQLFGYNVRTTEIYAAVGREQLRRLPETIVTRRINLAHFVAATHDLPIAHQRTVGQPSPFGLPFTLLDASRRPALVAALRAQGVDCRLPTGGSFLRHAYGAPWRDQKTPNADAIHAAGMFLGNAPFPIPNLIDRAVAVMREVL